MSVIIGLLLLAGAATLLCTRLAAHLHVQLRRRRLHRALQLRQEVSR